MARDLPTGGYRDTVTPISLCHHQNHNHHNAHQHQCRHAAHVHSYCQLTDRSKKSPGIESNLGLETVLVMRINSLYINHHNAHQHQCLHAAHVHSYCQLTDRSKKSPGIESNLGLETVLVMRINSHRHHNQGIIMIMLFGQT